jgi:hypothetical protein
MTRCNHTTLDNRCDACNNLKKKYYDLLEATGFKDIEYGQETAERLYQPVDLKKAADAELVKQAMSYYDSVWEIYHEWSGSGRPYRDCKIAELLAQQNIKTGTYRGIEAELKRLNLKPNSKRMVEQTIAEINKRVRHKKPRDD